MDKARSGKMDERSLPILLYNCPSRFGMESKNEYYAVGASNRHR